MTVMDEENIDERIKRILNDIKNQYGDDKAKRGDEHPPIRRISTRSPELDYATGGGIPIGRWSRLYGARSSGKSVRCWNVAAEAQSMGMTVAYYNAEKQYTAEFAQKQGVDTHNLIVVEGSVIEDIGEILEGLMADVDLHIIDSCSNCVSRTELSDGLNEREYMGLRPRKWAQQFAFAHERLDTSRNAVILVDQVRTKGLGTGFTSEGPPGGKYMEHISSMTVEFRPGGWLYYDKDGVLGDFKKRDTSRKTLAEQAEADGQEIVAKVVKSRVSRVGKSARMYFDLNLLEFDLVEEYFKAAKFFGIVEGGSWLKIPGEEKSIRPNEFRVMIEEDAELRKLIHDTMMNQ